MQTTKNPIATGLDEYRRGEYIVINTGKKTMTEKTDKSKHIANTTTDIKLFEEKTVRTHWDENAEEWYFSVVDVVEVLTESANPRDYWFKMKQRVKLEDGIELSTICRQLKMAASDGKKYLTDCANVQSLFRYSFAKGRAV